MGCRSNKDETDDGGSSSLGAARGVSTLTVVVGSMTAGKEDEPADTQCRRASKG